MLQVSAFLTLILCLIWPSIHVYSMSRILSRSRTHTVKTLPILKVPPCVLKSDLHLWHEPVMFWMKDKPCTFSVICTYYVSFSPCTKATMWLELVSYCTITNYYKTSDLKWHRYITLFFHRSQVWHKSQKAEIMKGVSCTASHTHVFSSFWRLPLPLAPGPLYPFSKPALSYLSDPTFVITSLSMTTVRKGFPLFGSHP